MVTSIRAPKASETLRSFLNVLQVKQFYPPPPATVSDLGVNALDFYLLHKGFGVQANSVEIGMAQSYLVEGLTYTSAEKKFQVLRKRGFAAMYSVCKLGGFQGREDRGSMTSVGFKERLRALGLG